MSAHIVGHLTAPDPAGVTHKGPQALARHGGPDLGDIGVVGWVPGLTMEVMEI